jgi:DNA-binding MarR family transcriptional regulator
MVNLVVGWYTWLTTCAMAADPRPGYALPLLLAGAFRGLVDRLHEELARQGHPGVRPVHGFALQALGAEGATTTQLARRLGVSKQAATKTVASLEALGYAEQRRDPSDARSRPVAMTDRGRDCLARSAAIFSSLRAELAEEIGEDAAVALEDALEALAGWGGGSPVALPGRVGPSGPPPQRAP